MAKSFLMDKNKQHTIVTQPSFRYFLLFLFQFLITGGIAEGEDIFIAQVAKGNNTGKDNANSHSVAWLDSSANWGIGDNKISPGDIVHLCGIITDPIAIKGNGTKDNVITFIFESGAIMSRPHWFQNGTNSDAAISGSGLQYITFDGGGNGIIECTNNGTNKTYQVDCSAFDLTNVSNITIRNMIIRNVFVRVEGTSDPNGNGIRIRGPLNNCFIKNNALNGAMRLMFFQFRAGDSCVEVSGNTGIDAGEGSLVIGSSNTDCTLKNVKVYNNTFSKGNGTWSGTPNIHTNCIHIYAVQTGSRIDNLQIYNNSLTGAWGDNSTAYIYLERNIFSPQVYNNFFLSGDPGAPGGNAYLFIQHSPGGAQVYNNTFVGNNSGRTGLMMTEGGEGIIQNNLFFNVSSPIGCPYDTIAIQTCDNNIFYNGTFFTFGNYSQLSFSQWKTRTSFDQQSTTMKPELNEQYAPTLLDTIARAKGKNLSYLSIFDTDKNSIQRSPTGPWTIGAFEKSILFDGIPTKLRVIK